jgi:putative oxidoreductase
MNFLHDIILAKPLKFYDTVMIIIRVITGLLLIYHGFEMFNPKLIEDYAKWEQIKNLPAPLFLSYLGKGSEFVCGIMFVLGFLTRIASLILILVMSFIVFIIGNGIFWYNDQHPFLFILIGIIYFFYGGGKNSLDRIIFKKF